MFRANMELDDRMDESTEDITAAETAPSPTKETHCAFYQFKRYQIVKY